MDARTAEPQLNKDNDHMVPSIDGYNYKDAELNASHRYLLPALEQLFKKYAKRKEINVFDLGCGNGSVSAFVASQGYQVTGIDPSSEGISVAKKSYPHLKLEVGSAYEKLEERFGRFELVYSLEVVEHVYSPRDYARTLAALLDPNGIAIVSTPYHGYFKNLALAVTGRLDKHFTVLWDHGHIKFWSVRTLSRLLAEQGLEPVEILRVGRIPIFAKSMIVVARKRS